MTKKKSPRAGTIPLPQSLSKSQTNPVADVQAHTMEKWMADLERIFEKAMEAEKFTVALKAKELIAKNQGWFLGGVASTPRTIKSIDQWTLQEMQEIILQLDAYEDQNDGGTVAEPSNQH